MHRPIVMEKVLEFMRREQAAFPGVLGEIEAYANERGIPVIPHETAIFLDFLMSLIRPKSVLEIGTAIGFSAGVMAQHLAPGGQLTTIDRYPKMYERAKENFEKLGIQDQITLIEEDAANVLPDLVASYDVIFMDSAKAKYVDFLPDCLRLLSDTGLILIDDVFQGGTVLDDEDTIPKRVRTIHRKLNKLLKTVHEDPKLKSSLLPLGDGILMIQKVSE